MKYFVYFIFLFSLSIQSINAQEISKNRRVNHSIKIAANELRIPAQFSNENSIVITGLKPNHNYQFTVILDDPGMPAFEIIGLKSNKLKPEENLQIISGENEIQFSVKGNKIEFELNFSLPKDQLFFGYMSVRDLTEPEMLKITNPRSPVISTNSNIGLDSLIKDFFIKSNCVEISNISFSGQNVQRGTFGNGTTSIGFKEGIMLATGGISVASGPNNTPSMSVAPGNRDNTHDPDLAKLVTEDQNNVAVLEFDFVPENDTVSFEYVFASEEYCDFVDSKFNDVFGFFLSGPGINGPFSNNGVNIALVPNTNTFVSINNVNHKKNSGYYIGNRPVGQSATDPDCKNHPFLPPGTVSLADCQFDGYTVPLIAMAQVIPCETYHIKLAIADISDGIYDSGVFFKLNSFSAGDGSTAEIVYNSTNKDSGIEGCSDVFFILKKPTYAAGLPFDFAFSKNAASTAIEGVDYESFPLEWVIPADKDTLHCHVNLLTDLIIEGNEKIVLNLLNGCVCDPLQVVLNIQDRPELFVHLFGDSICDGQTISLIPLVEGGVPPFSFKWSNNETTDSILVNLSGLNVFSVTVTEGCNQSKSDTTELFIASPITAQIVGDTVLCSLPTGHAKLQVNLSGQGPWQFTRWKDGILMDTITTNTNPYSFDADQTGTYTIGDLYNPTTTCDGITSGSATISLTSLNLNISAQPYACVEHPGSIDLNVSGGFPNYNYAWSGGFGNVEDLNNVPGGNYIVTVTDSKGCENEISVFVPELQPIALAQGEITEQNCLQPGSVTVNAAGGTPNYNFTWNTGPGGPSISQAIAGQYSVTVTDINGCTASLEMAVPADTIHPLADAGNTKSYNCFSLSAQLDGSASSQGNDFSYTWTAISGGNILNPDQLQATVNDTGQYQLIVVNKLNGCRDSAMTSVVRQFPTAQMEATQPFCVGDFGTIQVLGIQGGQSPYELSIDGVQYDNSLIFGQLGAGWYEITVRDALGCSYQGSLEIVAPEPFELQFDGIDTVQLGHSVQFQPIVDIPIDEIDSILWTPVDGLSCTNCLYPFASPFTSTKYTLTLISNQGCESRGTYELVIKRPTFFVPNMFSPNGDGQNDAFTVFAHPVGIKQVRQFLIFDRWGEMVFKNSNFPPNNLDFGWDGTLNNKPLNPGVFVWWVEVETIDGEVLFEKGSVTLIR